MENQEQTQGPDRSFFGIIIHSFFVIPFLIAIAAVLLFGTMQWLTREQLTAADYLEQVKTGGLPKRWQAAFELSKILANPKLIPQDEHFNRELETAFSAAGQDDPRVQQYLSLAMARTGNPRFFSLIVSALQKSNPKNQYALIYSLGMLRDPRAVPVIVPYLENTDARVRSISVVALGNIGHDSVRPALRKMLKDPEPNVQWGAAISLAKLKDASGRDILENLLDRAYLTQYKEVDPGEQTQLVLQAINASAGLNDQKLKAKLKELSQKDENMIVRSAALKSLESN